MVSVLPAGARCREPCLWNKFYVPVCDKYSNLGSGVLDFDFLVAWATAEGQSQGGVSTGQLLDARIRDHHDIRAGSEVVTSGFIHSAAAGAVS